MIKLEEIIHLPVIPFDPHKAQEFPVQEEAWVVMRHHSNHTSQPIHALIAGRSERGDVIYLAKSRVANGLVNPHSIWTTNFASYEKIPQREDESQDQYR